MASTIPAAASQILPGFPLSFLIATPENERSVPTRVRCSVAYSPGNCFNFSAGQRSETMEHNPRGVIKGLFMAENDELFPNGKFPLPHPDFHQLDWGPC